MYAPDTAAHWTKHWLYDWGGANVDFFLAIQRTVPDAWLWLPEVLSAVGSYLAAPSVVFLLLLWQRVQGQEAVSLLNLPLCRFVVGSALAIAATAFAKTVVALPRPFVVLGDGVYRAISAPDSLYSMPSGHSVYVAVLAAALWPSLSSFWRSGLLIFAAAVGWARIVLGAHFPADVVAGFALGWACVAAVGKLAGRIARAPPFPGAHR